MGQVLFNPQVLSQVVLPLALAVMMLVMGLSLRLEHFRRILQQPGLIALGLALQWFLLPLVAVLLIAVLNLAVEVALGLIILAACPGGATSNVISHLSGGDAALSVTLTAIVSLLAPLTLPLWISLMTDVLAIPSLSVALSFKAAALPLLLVTVIPLLTGMMLAARFRDWTEQHAPLLNRLSFLLFFALVVTLAWVNANRLPELWSTVTLACLGLCLMVMTLSAFLTQAMFSNRCYSRTLAIEAGIQNAGTAMLISVTLLQRPELALVALFYGILMNIPALLLIFYSQLRQPVYTDFREI
ncbi:bile acid:sodium symporter family protein [Bacterioplanoides sp. SCSIO 12839]|uniref:bile acid:sodium symporter family protein n=1 Tax=Bacterioplanoides sp. SCSIO 12839 TaxID=2829569 RepID=UPI00210430F7|nr:bile acid:sodium symporter [Bacterioplanoides sp. SCSIO 12839]UTW47152.1 bile acid:sodium symporter family protein [Bacterioplanoides sp. SCSIO 12839]